MDLEVTKIYIFRTYKEILVLCLAWIDWILKWTTHIIYSAKFEHRCSSSKSTEKLEF